MPKGLSGYKSKLSYYSPRNSWKQIVEILNHKKTDIGGKSKEAEALFTEFVQNEMSFSAFRILRILSPEFVKAQKIVHSINKKIQFTHMYGFTPGDPGKLRVYPNLEVNNTSDFDLFLEACPYHRHAAIEALIKRINADMLNPNAAKGWIPTSRGRARIKRFEDMPIERALMRYSDASKHYDEKTIKGIAGQLEELRLPLELHYAETPEQILYMYSSGPSSCMFVGGKERPWQWMTDIGRHPDDFFAFHPYVRGVYTKVKSKGTVTARTFLYTKEDGKEYHGRIYGADGRTQIALMNALHELGIIAIPINGESDRNGQAGSFMRECEFTIPGIENGGDVYMPFPYLDNLRGGISFEYDAPKKEFKVKCYDGSGHCLSNGKKIKYHEFPGYTGLTCGYVAASQVRSGAPCYSCGARVTGTWAAMAERVTGYQYCGNTCINSSGRVIARLGNGTNVIMIKTEAYKDTLTEAYYTTEESCRENGGRQYYTDPLTVEEDPILSTIGYAHVYGDTHIRFQNSRAAVMFRDYQRYNILSKITQTNHKYLEIDFDKLVGVKFIGNTSLEHFSTEDVTEGFGYKNMEPLTRTGFRIRYDSDGRAYFEEPNNGDVVRLYEGSTNIRNNEEVAVAA